MRLRLSDAVGFAFLAEQYCTHAETCRRMASVTVGPERRCGYRRKSLDQREDARGPREGSKGRRRA